MVFFQRTPFLVGLFLGCLLLLFQNFSFIKKNPVHALEKFLPAYIGQEKIAEMDVPSGYVDYINDKIAEDQSRKVFDDKKFIKDTLEQVPVYQDIKGFIDTAGFAQETCSSNPADTENNCLAVSEDSGPIDKDASQDLKFKLKGNPMRGIASVAVSGPIDSSFKYEQNTGNVMIEFNRKIDDNTNIRVEMESENKEGKIKLDMSW